MVKLFRRISSSPSAHARALARRASAHLRERYAAGQREHGGWLWAKAGVLAHATDEAIDLVVYLATLRAQLAAIADALRRGEVEEALAALEAVLGPPEA